MELLEGTGVMVIFAVSMYKPYDSQKTKYGLSPDDIVVSLNIHAVVAITMPDPGFTLKACSVLSVTEYALGVEFPMDDDIGVDADARSDAAVLQRVLLLQSSSNAVLS